MDKKIQIIFDSFGRLLASAEEDRETANLLVLKLKNQIDEYENEQRKLNQNVRDSIAQTINKEINRSMSNVIGKFDDIERVANQVAVRYENSSRWAIWKVILTGIVIFSLFTSIVFAAMNLYIPSLASQIKNLNVEKKELISQIKELEKSGALAKFSHCDDDGKSRLCVRVHSIDQNKCFGENCIYKIVHGY